MSDENGQVQKAAKKAMSYQNGKIYKVVNDLNDFVYIGSTTQPLPKRWGLHKSASQKKSNKFYDAVRELGSEHFRIVLIENFPCGSRAELEAREYSVQKNSDATKLYNSIIGGKHPQDLCDRRSEAMKGEKNHFFARGGITHDERKCALSFRFRWSEDGQRCTKSFSYGTKRSKEMAYMAALAEQERVYPLKNSDYLAELPCDL
jgi:hypothetical protein